MDTKKNEDTPKKAVTHIAILAVVVSLIVITILLAGSNFDFVDFVIKLHGG